MISYFWGGLPQTFSSIDKALEWWGNGTPPPSSIEWEIVDEMGDVLRHGGERVDEPQGPGDWLRWEQTDNGLVRLD
jgi:hypothetical protein